MDKPAILLIGGLDPQGCAGMMADSQTVHAHGCHAVPLMTCLTEQTQTGLSALGALSPEQFMRQYESCVADFDIAAIKVGLIPDVAIASCVKTIIEKHKVPVIWDPVLASTSGGETVGAEFQQYLIENLLIDITLLTPNAIELEQLTKYDSTLNAVNYLFNHGLNACLVKGGHQDSKLATDYYSDNANSFYCYADKQAISVRGTGCVLASSIASYLALNYDVRDAIVLAKAYVTRGIRNAYRIGTYHLIAHSCNHVELCDMPKLTYSEGGIGEIFNFPPCPHRLGIYPVVDSSEWIKKLITTGIKTIQLRIKDLTEEQRKAEIQKAIQCCDASIAFFVNDYWREAVAFKAYGVHLGQEDLHDANLFEIENAGLRLGVSTHSYWELARALAINPSYIALGPVFETTSKAMPWLPQGIERVKQWVNLLANEYSLVAIGGINQSRAEQLLRETGVGSVAMISAITKADDYKKAVHDLLTLWHNTRARVENL